MLNEGESLYVNKGPEIAPGTFKFQTRSKLPFQSNSLINLQYSLCHS